MSPWIIVVGASAGGVSALTILVRGLPPNLNAAVYVVLHVPPHSPSHLSEFLGRCTRLPVSAACDGGPLRAGTIVVARADHHLMIERDRIRVTRGPIESRARPSIDVLFRSAAAAHGRRVIGVVLTGMLDDGTAGLWAVKDRGGVALVQDPASAEFPAMPQSAIANVEIDRVVALDGLAHELVRRVQKSDLAERGAVEEFAAAWRLAEKRLSPVVGTQTVAALYKRSLLQTSRSHAWLSGAHESVAGSVDLSTLKAALTEQEPGDEAVVFGELLQTFYGLVSGLIGGPFTRELTSFDAQGPAHLPRAMTPLSSG
jgi:hypothetical protein